MPIYAYRCDACSFAKDALQKVSDAPLTDCPSCGKPAFKKQLTAAGFQLKGTGWYVTDFRGDNKPKAAVTAPAASADAAAPASSPATAHVGVPATGKAADTAAATPAAGAPAAGAPAATVTTPTAP